jgi:hypothetical protein
VEGDREPSVGAAAVTVKVKALDGALPGFTAVMDAMAGASWAGSGAVSWVVLTKMVETAVPFHWTCDAGMKPEPLTVRLKAGPPDVTEVGLREEMVGGGVAIVKVRLLEKSPDGLAIRTAAVPAVVTRPDGIWAVS